LEHSDYRLDEMEVWRLLRTNPAHGAWNMAVDEAVMEAVAARASTPTLRLFAWNPPCLSLGYAQPITDVDLTALADHAWDLVRRPTGGRAILHTDELTYSICARQDHPLMEGGVLESYRRISLALLAALDKLNLQASAEKTYQSSGGSPNPAAVCFEVPSNYEITVNGLKLIGSAQSRRMEAVLQHGTLPLCGDITRITQVLKYDTPQSRQTASQRLLEHAATTEMLTGRVISWDEAASAFQAAFEEILGFSFEPAVLSAQEEERAAQLVQTKYANPNWTERI
jgi:lipoyl(octanoyl) transferase